MQFFMVPFSKINATLIFRSEVFEQIILTYTKFYQIWFRTLHLLICIYEYHHICKQKNIENCLISNCLSSSTLPQSFSGWLSVCLYNVRNLAAKIKLSVSNLAETLNVFTHCSILKISQIGPRTYLQYHVNGQHVVFQKKKKLIYCPLPTSSLCLHDSRKHTPSLPYIIG